MQINGIVLRRSAALPKLGDERWDRIEILHKATLLSFPWGFNSAVVAAALAPTAPSTAA